jgi:hypothetical protein
VPGARVAGRCGHPRAAAFAAHLPPLPGDPHGIAVFPGADHGLFVADPDPAVPRTDQLAPGYLDMVAGFLAARWAGGCPRDQR